MRFASGGVSRSASARAARSISEATWPTPACPSILFAMTSETS